MNDGMPMRLSDGWRIAVSDGLVTQIAIDYALGLDIAVNRDVTIHVRIESDFTHVDDIGTELISWQSAAELGRFADLHNEQVTDFCLEDTGALRIRFASGRRMDVAPNPHYESYQVSPSKSAAEGGFLFVGAPGSG